MAEVDANPQPVIKPTLGALIAIIVLLLVAGVGMLLVARNVQQVVGAFVMLSLLAATLCFGLLGATGAVKTRNGQLGGSAGIFVIILGILLRFAGSATYKIDGAVYLDDTPVTDGTIVLLDSVLKDPKTQLNSVDGSFSFIGVEKKPQYRFQIVIPKVGNLTTSATSDKGRINISLKRAQFVAEVPEINLAPILEACKTESGTCTLFVFDFLRDAVSDDQLQLFQNTQQDRLDRGIRNFMSSARLPDSIDFSVKRCAAFPIKDATLAERLASKLASPAIMWGYVGRTADKVVWGSTFTIVDGRVINLTAREELAGQDITNIIDYSKPIEGTPLIVATFLLGDAYLKKQLPDSARICFLKAQELTAALNAPNADFKKAIERRLAETQTTNPAHGLTPIGT